MYYDRHIFCCLNERPEGHERGSCARGGAEGLQNYLKARLKEVAMTNPGVMGRVRANKAGCLDRCELGPVLVIYPEGAWYRVQNKTDVDEIIETHLLRGQPVARLLLSDDQ